MTVRTRFSPSPTGMIHLGNVRAALFSALFAKKNKGIFILRIEDTDAARSEEKFVESLQDDLKWADIHWQEGPGVGGAYGPYWQSQRQEIYDVYYKQLEEKKLIYPCFCSDQELALARKLQLSRGHAPRYMGTCLKLSKEEIEKRMAEGKKPAWRFAIPADQAIEFDDLVKGRQVFLSQDIGDFIVRRADGTPPFLFCNAIDDATMKVTHVLRGEDHVANTPRQILILQALGLPISHYGHLSLIVGEDGAPLSKRHGSFSLNQLRDDGYLSSAIINYLGRLGHTSDNQELLDFDHLSEHFFIDKLSRSPARFDLNQLMYWQKLAVQSMSTEELWRWLGESVANQVPANMQTLFAENVRANVAFPQDASMWANIFFHEGVHIDEDNLKVLKEAGEQFFVEAEQAVETFGLDLKRVLDEMKRTLSVNGKKLFMPMRVALTGKIHGPELAQIAELLGYEKVKQRLGQAVQIAGSKNLSK